ncbi:ABC transporter ATP-binding protein [Acrasis kona]|uniref:ABC transporter ATP-binding protein n=1 Tax=Acrasis kona TaxID=1008807 RepID=A0AAW2ZJP0_9EUKA
MKTISIAVVLFLCLLSQVLCQDMGKLMTIEPPCILYNFPCPTSDPKYEYLRPTRRPKPPSPTIVCIKAPCEHPRPRSLAILKTIAEHIQK